MPARGLAGPLGVGARPALGWLLDSPLQLANGIDVDGRTNLPDVDVARTLLGSSPDPGMLADPTVALRSLTAARSAAPSR